MTVTSELVDIYCRSAAEDGNTLEAQKAACRQFAKDAGLTVGMVYTEIASGASLKREKLALLRARYTDGVVQGVVVMTLERLSRHAPDLLTLREEMKEHSVMLYIVKERSEQVFSNLLDCITSFS
jgi:DNA invertase Pin-like site-specific DNA recombinase